MAAPQGSWHDPTRHDWDRQPERGSARLARLMIWLSLALGWRVGTLLLVPITLYFFLWSRGAKANSQVYLTRALGRPAGARDVFRQYFTFAAVILDRMFLLAGRTAAFDVTLVGLEHLTRRLEDGGCLMLGAHVGSFEILRAVAPRRHLEIKALMHRNEVTPLSGPLERLDPRLGEDIIEIGAVDAMLRVREWLARGAVVGILGDRAPQGSLGRRAAGRLLSIPFLGHHAVFPTGPLLMAAALEAPVVLFWGVRTGPRRYEIRFEPFAERVILGDNRRADLAGWVGRYAARLEACCRAHPYNWFNLYNFWGQGDGGVAVGPADGGGAAAGDDACRGRGGFRGGGPDAAAGERAGAPFDLHGGADRRPADHLDA